MQQNSHRQEMKQIEPTVSQFLLKTLHIILSSRIPSIGGRDRLRGGGMRGSIQASRSDRWFELVLGGHPAALDNLSFWHRNLTDPMVIDIVLVHENLNSSLAENVFRNGTVETVIERWIIQFECQQGVTLSSRSTVNSSDAYMRIYKKTTLLIRSLYSTMRLLPAYHIFKKLSSSNNNCNFDVIYKVSSFSEPLTLKEMEAMNTYSFTPVVANPGRFCASVIYHPTLSSFNLEHSTSLSSQIITDYVGSPATDPHRYFTALEDKGVHAISLPQKVARLPSNSPFQHPHSWTSGFHKAAPYECFGGSPPANHISPLSHDISVPSPPGFKIYGDEGHNVSGPSRHQHRHTGSFDDYNLSPPFSTFSPSPPSHFSKTTMKSRLYRETAPVAIPLPTVKKNPTCLSPCSYDISRQSLPPPSPASLKLYPSSQESPSRNRSFGQLNTSRMPESYTGATTQHSVHRSIRDGKDDSSRFSGLSSSASPHVGISRSSSRLSFQDDLEEPDFSCPFDVDDVDPLDSHLCQGPDGRRTSDHGSEDAAVGALVHMLRTAPPLRQDSTYTTNLLNPSNPQGESVTSSCFFNPRKTSDALDELRSYTQMKNMLLSKTGTTRIGKQS